MADKKPDCVSKIKRERSENFDSATLAFLCDEVEKYIDIINSKQTNFITNKRKQEVWQKITDAVNARGGAPRSVSQLKEKYRKSVSAAKIASNIRKKELFKTGGGSAPPPLSDISQKLCQINDDTPSFSGIANSIEFGTNSNSDTITIHDIENFVFSDGASIPAFNCKPYNEDYSRSPVPKNEMSNGDVAKTSGSNSHDKDSNCIVVAKDLTSRCSAQEKDEETVAQTIKESHKGKIKGNTTARCPNKTQGQANLKQLQIDALRSEKRKNEAEIEKFQEETKKLKEEVNKLKEERDLYKIQNNYYQLKLKKLKAELNEQ